MTKIFFLFILTFQSTLILAQSKGLTQEEKENEILDYSNIRSVLKSDGLEEVRNDKNEFIKEIKKQRKNIHFKKYNYPKEDDFWVMSSELWLVKNAQLLRWDFPKPDYGIGVAFQQLLEKFGYYNENYKILVVNTPNVTHFGFPAGKNSYIFILSLPFMRSLDLTKVDLSLLIFEDFLRLKEGYFIQNLELDTKFLGSNFYKSKDNKKIVKEVLEKYSSVVFKTGFNFQQQYEITKKMDSYLKSEPPLWSAYFKLYHKLERFIKTDILYKNYLKIYPSPELQLKWLSPKKKVI